MRANKCEFIFVVCIECVQWCIVNMCEITFFIYKFVSLAFPDKCSCLAARMVMTYWESLTLFIWETVCLLFIHSRACDEIAYDFINPLLFRFYLWLFLNVNLNNLFSTPIKNKRENSSYFNISCKQYLFHI